MLGITLAFPCTNLFDSDFFFSPRFTIQAIGREVTPVSGGPGPHSGGPALCWISERRGNATKALTTAVLGVSSLPHPAESWLGLPSDEAVGAAVNCSLAKPRPRTPAVLRADATLPGLGVGVGMGSQMGRELSVL